MGATGSPAAATTRPPRYGPMARHCSPFNSAGSTVISGSSSTSSRPRDVPCPLAVASGSNGAPGWAGAQGLLLRRVARVEGVAQAVADEVDREDRQEDADP